MQNISIEKRFWSKVNKTDDQDGCWEWTASRSKEGYGWFYKDGKMTHASRACIEIIYKIIIPSNIFVCHTCDNPPCVNPHHLFVGTRTDNVRDMVKKGRLRTTFSIPKMNPGHLHPELRQGERNGSSKLTEEHVREIRLLHYEGIKTLQLAKTYNVSSCLIRNVVYRRTWKHVL